MTGFFIGALTVLVLLLAAEKIKIARSRKINPTPQELEDAAEAFELIVGKIKASTDTESARCLVRFWRSVAPRIHQTSRNDSWLILLDLMRVKNCILAIGVPDSEKQTFAVISAILTKRFKRGGGVIDGYDISS